jgi:hypothetical protein
MQKTMLFLFAATICAGHFQALAADGGFVFAKDVPVQVHLADKPLPQWRDGAVVVFDSSHGADQMGIDIVAGHQRSRLTFAVPAAKRITMRGFSRGTDGTVALCGGLTDAEGRSGSYVGWISSTGQEVHVIRTSPFVAVLVALAPDGTIWTQGTEIRPRAPGEPSRQTLAEALKGDAAVFRQFSRSGKLLRTVVPQSEITDPLGLTATRNVFEAVGDRIVWYSSTSRQHISIGADGAVIVTNDLPMPNNEEVTGGAIGARGELLASSVNGSTWSVSRLDLARKRWVPNANGLMGDRTAPAYRATVLGSDGDHLVVNGRGGHNAVRFFRVSQ